MCLERENVFNRLLLMPKTKTALIDMWILYSLSLLKAPRRFMKKMLCSQTGPLTLIITVGQREKLKQVGCVAKPSELTT